MRTRLINLTFHGIGKHTRQLEPGEDSVWVTRERFASVLDRVAGRDGVHITFDDGNASDVHCALPELRERGLTATFFIVAGRLGVPGFLDAGDVCELAGAGMTIGSHGMRHRPWRGLDNHDLDEELVQARQALEDVVGRRITAAACPFGSYGRRSLDALRRAGYARVYTSDRGPAVDGAWLQARNTITEHDPLEPILSSRSTLTRSAKQVLKRWR